MTTRSGPHEVVITGMGAVTGLGLGAQALARGLQGGRCALRPLQSFDPSGLEVHLAAEVPEPIEDHPDFPDDRKSTLALLAAEEALAQAGLTQLSGGGLWLGTGLSSLSVRELEEDIWPHMKEGEIDGRGVVLDTSRERVAPWRHHPWRTAEHLRRAWGAGGPVSSSFSACAASAQAIAQAFWAIRRGEVSTALCGGQDSMVHPLGVLSFIVLGALSPDRCRPFDRRRDGFSIGEGAAMLVLESEQHARARGAEVLARVLGAGSSVDAWRVTAPHPEGLGAELSMRRALKDAGLPPEAIDQVHAHGTGTPLGDQAESLAVLRVFGSSTPVASIKGALGHCIAAAGAVEAVASAMGIREGWTPGTVGLEEPAELGIHAQREARQQPVRHILSNSFGFGGENCSLILGCA